VNGLVRLKVDVLVTGFMSEVLAARQATTTIPIVMSASVDPVGNGLVASLSRPGRNVTGMTVQPPEFGGKQVELLKQAVPQVSRVAVLWDPTFPGFAAFYKHAETAARALGFALQSIELRQSTDIEPALARITQEHADGLAIWPTNFMILHLPRILDFATQRRLPTMFPATTFMSVGALMAYGVNQIEQYRRIAMFIDKILKGANPAELPVRAADEVRAGHQPQDRQGPRPDDPAVGARAGGRSDRVMWLPETAPSFPFSTSSGTRPLFLPPHFWSILWRVHRLPYQA
jgi:ABC-type uncharacterized transport system substrate-binding protein